MGGEWLEEKELSKFRRFIKPNTSKILVTIILFIVLSIVVSCPVEVTTTAWGGYYLSSSVEYQSSTVKPMMDVLIQGGNWEEWTYLEGETVLIVQEYDANSLFVIIFVPATLIILYFLSCLLDKYYSVKIIKSN